MGDRRTRLARMKELSGELGLYMMELSDDLSELMADPDAPAYVRQRAAQTYVHAGSIMGRELDRQERLERAQYRRRKENRAAQCRPTLKSPPPRKLGA